MTEQADYEAIEASISTNEDPSNIDDQIGEQFSDKLLTDEEKIEFRQSMEELAGYSAFMYHQLAQKSVPDDLCFELVKIWFSDFLTYLRD